AVAPRPVDGGIEQLPGHALAAQRRIHECVVDENAALTQSPVRHLGHPAAVSIQREFTATARFAVRDSIRHGQNLPLAPPPPKSPPCPCTGAGGASPGRGARCAAAATC